MARKKKRKLAFVPADAQPQSGDSGNHVSWFGTADRLTDSSSHKVGDTSSDPLTGRNLLTGAQETRREGAASQVAPPVQAFADAVLAGDPAQIRATYEALPQTPVTGMQVIAAFTAMPQDQRDTVVKNVDANADFFGAGKVFAFKTMIKTAPPAPSKASAVSAPGVSGKGLGAGASNQAHLDGVDTRLIAAWDYAAAKTGGQYSLVGPRSGTRSVEDAKKNAAAGIGVEHSLHIADKSGVGHAGDLYVNGKTPTPAFAAAVKEYAAQEGYHVRWGGTDFRLPNGNRDPNHFDLGTRVGGVAFKAGATDPAAVEVAMAAPAAKSGNVESYIRQAAAARGIDPNVAVRVAKGEGGLSDPLQQSYVVKDGKRETSYGPFQLRIGGGLGDKALAAGIDPRKESDWKKGVDFALNHAAVHGWGEWYGAVNPGPKSGLSPIGVRAGLNGAKPVAVGTMIAGAGGQDVAVGGDRSGGAAALAAGIGNHGLRKGSGNAVATRALQSALNDLGATDRFGNALKVDGRFGNRTYEAVKNYQADAGIPDDGVVGPQTYKHISGDMADASFGVHVGTEGSPELAGQVPHQGPGDAYPWGIPAPGARPFVHTESDLRGFAAGAALEPSGLKPYGMRRSGAPPPKAQPYQDYVDPDLTDRSFSSAQRPQVFPPRGDNGFAPDRQPYGPEWFNGTPSSPSGADRISYAEGAAVAAVHVDPVVSRAVRIPTEIRDGWTTSPVPADHPLRAQIEHVQNVSHWLDQPPSASTFDSYSHSAFSPASDPYRPTGGSNGSFTGAVSGGSSSSGSFDSFAAGMSHTYQTAASGGSVTQPSYSVGGAGVYTPPAASPVTTIPTVSGFPG